MLNIELDQKPKTKKCEHGFDIKDLMDLTKEPKCKKCHKTLTELEKDKDYKNNT